MIGFLALYLWGQNVIFNPGFDMTPWDTGWTIETDTATNGSCRETAEAQAIPDTGKSLPNCCYLKTVVVLNPQGWCGGGGYAKSTMSQTFNEIPACTVKMQVKHWAIGGPGVCDYDTKTFIIEARINNIWQKIWEKESLSYNADTTWKEVVIGLSSPISGIKLQTFSRIYCSSINDDASWCSHFHVDDISIEEVGVEVEKLKVKSAELKVYPNPFVSYTRIGSLESKDVVQVYDMMGRLVEETISHIVGKDLPKGIYFVKLKGYKLVKMIKIGRLK